MSKPLVDKGLNGAEAEPQTAPLNADFNSDGAGRSGEEISSSVSTDVQRSDSRFSNRDNRWVLVTFLVLEWGVILALPPAVGLPHIPVKKSFFSLNDPSISHPAVEPEIISPVLLLCVMYPITLGLIIFICLVKRRSLSVLYQSLLSYLFATAVISIITTTAKSMVGRPRPDFLSYCQVDWSLVDENKPLQSSTICSQPNKRILDEEFRSFPSGHSSHGFGACFFLTLFISGQFCLFRPPRFSSKMLIPLLPFWFGLFIALSRVTDHRHHPSDVIAGSVIGIIISSLSYFLFFPNITSKYCWKPYDIPLRFQNDRANDIESQL